MIEINEFNHSLVLSASLNKIYNKSRINGKIESIDLYLLNILFNLINDCNSTLDNNCHNKLTKLYRSIYNESNQICKISLSQNYLNDFKTKTIVQEVNDSNQTPIIILRKIFYWQEEEITRDFTDVYNDIIYNDYLRLKPFDTEAVFNVGKNINYSNIAKICFAVNNTEAEDDYRIYDINNNDVTHSFIKIDIAERTTILFVSNNVYSHGLMNIKVKKIN